MTGQGDDLDAVEARLAGIQPEDWSLETWASAGWYIDGALSDRGGHPVGHLDFGHDKACADFVFAAPTDMAALVAEVRRLRAERDALAAARNDEPGRKRHEYAEAEITHYGETFTACIVCREDKSDWRHSTAARVLAEVHAAEEGGR